MAFSIVRSNIVDMHVDAIVNSANPHAAIGRGVDEAIHAAAGPELLEARKRIGDIAVGQAVITDAFNLPARIVVHTVGPLWQGGSAGEEAAVESCYTHSLETALEAGCASIAFPLISTGTYGFPKDRALSAATRAIQAFLLHHDMDVYLVVFDDESFRLSENLAGSVADFIGANLVEKGCSCCGEVLIEGARFCTTCGTPVDVFADESFERRVHSAPIASFGYAEQASWAPNASAQHTLSAAPMASPAPRKPGLLKRLGESIKESTQRKETAESTEDEYADFCAPSALPPSFEGQAPVASGAPAPVSANFGRTPAKRKLEDVIEQVDESFSEALLRLIDEKGLDDPTVYKRANIDRKLFSKIRSNPAYQPKKTTALALALALELSLDETLDLVGRAGYTLSHASKADLIVEYFIEQSCYDLFVINETLFAFDQPLIGR